ncbi:hypothetical protein BWZ20_10170 [Winogradskyella sp. J14-2]|uniref:DUF4270 domain-containing protein n=1 Tax=Winogradskyella sp. J14-2 TaxID=1936080 RepID=UPI000972D218|nr:DUF4270 domain-containing protein [Winogradskyella sp. J14-2]APY08644.1 hypothetical protein BWZ20_10170 [Winogradskyella sp. J14-2]
MNNTKFALNIFALVLIISSFIACDSDFNNLESDVLNSDVATNFNIKKLSETNPEFSDVITYSQALGPVQSNNGPGLSTLGVYDDSYGRVESSFVAQLTLSSYSPDFGEVTEVDSVVLNLPFFSAISDVDEDGNITYETDSVFGSQPIKLSIYRSNYFIRNVDPNSDFNESQPYFSNKSASENELISDANLESELVPILPNPDPETNKHVTLDANGDVTFSNEGFILTSTEGEGENEETTTLRQIPGIRLKLDPQFWEESILNQQTINPTVLSNQNNFLEYFRGLYFKAETVNNDGAYYILSTSTTAASITIYYKRISESTIDDEDATEQASFAMRFGGNRINFLDPSYNVTIPDGDPINGDSRLYLKGGEGAIAKIKLFNGDDLNDGDDLTFDNWKNFFVDTDEDGNFKSIKRIVNEANLVFYVDEDFFGQTGSYNPDNEPHRLYVYDIENKGPLRDFSNEFSNNSLPSISKINHLGALQRVDDDPNQKGVKYKFRITEHINNLLFNDSTNVELGLSVSLNVNLEEQFIQNQTLTTENPDLSVPISSVLSPKGTLLHGNNTNDPSKKVYLEIFYTEPND